MELNVYKIRTGAKLPRRAHKHDAGADIFYCPSEVLDSFLDAHGNVVWNKSPSDSVKIGPGESTLVPTGIKIGVPENFMLEVKNKSGIAYKRQLIVGSCVIDSKYDGEIFVNLHNIGGETQQIRSGEKIAQVVLLPISVCKFGEIKDDAVYGTHTNRGDSGFGSTGDF